MSSPRATMRTAAERAARQRPARPAIAVGVIALAWPLLANGCVRAEAAGDETLSLRPSPVLAAPQIAQADAPKSSAPRATPPKQAPAVKEPPADALLREAIEFQQRKIGQAADEVRELNAQRSTLQPPAREDN